MSNLMYLLLLVYLAHFASASESDMEVMKNLTSKYKKCNSTVIPSQCPEQSRCIDYGEMGSYCVCEAIKTVNEKYKDGKEYCVKRNVTVLKSENLVSPTTPTVVAELTTKALPTAPTATISTTSTAPITQKTPPTPQNLPPTPQNPPQNTPSTTQKTPPPPTTQKAPPPPTTQKTPPTTQKAPITTEKPEAKTTLKPEVKPAADPTTEAPKPSSTEAPKPTDDIKIQPVAPIHHHILGGIFIPTFIVLAFVCGAFAVKKYNLIEKARTLLRNRNQHQRYNGLMENEFDDDDPLLI